MPMIGILGRFGVLPVNAELEGVAFSWVSGVGDDVINHLLTSVDVGDGLQSGSGMRSCIKSFEKLNIK